MYPFGDDPLGALLRSSAEADRLTITADTDTAKPLTRSVVFDVVSLSRALFEFLNYVQAKYGAKKVTFDGSTVDQAAFLEYMAYRRTEIMAATGLTSLASDDASVLNSFLSANGSNRVIDPFDGVGVVTIYRLLVEWVNKAEVGMLKYQGKDYAAFTVEPDDVVIHTLNNRGDSTFERVILELPTKTGHTVWISELPPDLSVPTNAMEVVSTVDWLVGIPRHVSPYATTGAKIPMIGFRTNVELDWLKGITATYEGDCLTLTQATQDWKVDINEIGAKVEVITTVVMSRGGGPGSDAPLTIDQPVFVWVTAPGSFVPQAVMFCHPDDTWLPVS
jgi:hypothetical protein